MSAQDGDSSKSGGKSGNDGDHGEEECADARKLNAPHLQDLIGKEALQYRPPVRLSEVSNHFIIL